MDCQVHTRVTVLNRNLQKDEGPSRYAKGKNILQSRNGGKDNCGDAQSIMARKTKRKNEHQNRILRSPSLRAALVWNKRSEQLAYHPGE
jgi:hypothetical protein